MWSFHLAGLSRPKAVAGSLAVGITREVIQRQGREGWRDVGADVVGVTVGAVVRVRW